MNAQDKLILSCLPVKWRIFYKRTPSVFDDYLYREFFNLPFKELLKISSHTGLFDVKDYLNNSSSSITKRPLANARHLLLTRSELKVYNALPESFSLDDFRFVGWACLGKAPLPFNMLKSGLISTVWASGVAPINGALPASNDIGWFQKGPITPRLQ